MTLRKKMQAAIASNALMLMSMSAHAHHLMHGEIPKTFTDGLLSGVGHPVIGIDHFAAVVAVGLIASFREQKFTLISAFFGSTIIGVLLHLMMSAELPWAEIGIASSIVALGMLLMRRSHASLLSVSAVFALAGVFHGYAYGESIVGAEPAPLGGYLLGLIVIQGAVASAVAYIARAALREQPMHARGLSVVSGSMLVLMGLALIPF